jgi:SAM-dependent methyltransferase
LPFPDSTFDGAMAASSVEQTTNTEATLAEIMRVLKPGGRLRLIYESLDQYRDGHEQEFAFWPLSDSSCKLLIYDRRIRDETVYQYSFTLDISEEGARTRLNLQEHDSALSMLKPDTLRHLSSAISEPRKCILHHPSGATYTRMLKDAGFKEVRSTQSGRAIAARIFDDIPTAKRPGDMSGVDGILLPEVRRTVHLPVVLSADPDITAIR